MGDPDCCGCCCWSCDGATTGGIGARVVCSTSLIIFANSAFPSASFLFNSAIFSANFLGLLFDLFIIMGFKIVFALRMFKRLK